MRKFLLGLFTAISLSVFAATLWHNGNYLETSQRGFLFGNGNILSVVGNDLKFNDRRVDNGSSDIYHKQDFEGSITAPSFTCGNNAAFLGGGVIDGDFVNETSAKISGSISAKYTQGASSLNDYCASPVINLDSKQKGNFSYVTLYYTHDGDPSDIQFVFYDVTNTNILDVVLVGKASTDSQRAFVSFKIPSNTTSIRYGFQTLVGNAGKILKIDDVEFSTNHSLQIVGLHDTQNYRIFQQTSAMTNLSNEIEFNLGTATISNSGASLLVASDESGNSRTVWTATRDAEVTVHAAGILANGSRSACIGKNGTPVIWGASPDAVNGGISGTSGPIKLEAGDYLSMGTCNTGVVPILFDNSMPSHVNFSATLSFVARASLDHVVTSKSTTREYSESSGDFDVTGTNWVTTKAVAVPYKVDGVWRMKFNIVGAITSGSANFITLSMAGTTFAHGGNQSISFHDGGIAARDWNASSYVISGTDDLGVQGRTSVSLVYTYLFSGDVELASKPSWADEVSGTYLSATPSRKTINIFPTSSGTIYSIAGSTSFKTLQINKITGDTEMASLSSDQLSLKKGTYTLSTTVGGRGDCDYLHGAIYNVTTASYIYDQQLASSIGSSGIAFALLNHNFTLLADSSIEIRSRATNGACALEYHSGGTLTGAITNRY